MITACSTTNTTPPWKIGSPAPNASFPNWTTITVSGTGPGNSTNGMVVSLPYPPYDSIWSDQITTDSNGNWTASVRLTIEGPLKITIGAVDASVDLQTRQVDEINVDNFDQIDINVTPNGPDPNAPNQN